MGAEQAVRPREQQQAGPVGRGRGRGEQGDHDVHGIGPVSPMALQNLHHLQRTAGNRATTLAVQRAKKLRGKVVNPFDAISGTSEQKSPGVNFVGGGFDPSSFTKVPDPNATPKMTDASVGIGLAGGSLGGVQGITGLVGGSIATSTAVKARKHYKRQGIKAGVVVENRNIKMGGTDIAKNIVQTGSAVTEVTSKVMAVTQAGSTAANQAGVAAGGWAAPLALFNALRDGRKGVKAWMRCARLQKQLDSWNEPRQKLNELKERLEALEEARTEAEGEHAKAKTAADKAKTDGDAAQAELTKLQDDLRNLTKPAAKSGIGGKIKGAFNSVKHGVESKVLEAKIWAKEREVTSFRAAEQAARADMVEFERQVQTAVDGKKNLEPETDMWMKKHEEMVQVVGNTSKAALDDEMKKATGKGSGIQARGKTKGPEEPTLLEINAYAFEKNYAGTIKKLTASLGGLFTTAAGAASLAVSIAALAGGGALVMATPVGWALAGIAAAIGLGLGAYKAFKWLRKRWQMSGTDKAGNQRTGASRLGQTLAFWKPAGKSRRDLYGKKLLEYALGDQCYKEQMLEARKTIAALGIDWAALDLGDLALGAPDLPAVTAPVINRGGSVGAGSSTGIEGGASQAHDFDFQARGESQKKGATQKLPVADWKVEMRKKKAGTAGFDAAMVKKLMKFKAAKVLVATKLGS